ncbi:hypothetical secreted protein [Azoarcus olearius]|uniref:Hypothetical secreted protein n=1 Tax=Azoarcus sp. (strain BH72) TaxID=418699 RepID=A1KBV4_AZOSB|nr:hypothetical secreted protein [Azoarcus olearius]
MLMHTSASASATGQSAAATSSARAGSRLGSAAALRHASIDASAASSMSVGCQRHPGSCAAK